MFLFLFCLEKFDLFEAALSRVCSLPSPGKVFLKKTPPFPLVSDRIWGFCVSIWM